MYSVLDNVSESGVKSKVTLTGHSLGGFLAQKLTLDMIDKTGVISNPQFIDFKGTVTFNAQVLDKKVILKQRSMF